MNRIMLLLAAAIIAALVSSCGKPNPLGPEVSTTECPTCPPDTACIPDTVWSSVGANGADVNVDHPYGTLIEGFNLDCSPVNIVIDTVWVSYSDTYDQDLEFYLQNTDASELTYSLVDSTGSSIVHQPPNYSGLRRVIVSARNLPPATYALMVHYRGTIGAPQGVASASSPNAVLWHANIKPGRLAIGCITCRPRRP